MSICHKSPEEILKWSQTLERLTELDAALPKEISERSNQLERLQSIWERTRSKGFESTLSELEALNPRIHAIYETLPITEKTKDYAKDILSVGVRPVIPSNNGINGPTLLVSYPRKERDHLIHTGVIKWTGSLEFSCGEFLRGLSRLIPGEVFHVPQASFLDFDKATYTRLDEGQEPLEEDIAAFIREAFFAIKKNTKAPTPEELSNAIILTERIRGANLISFADEAVWSQLSPEQKSDLFKKLGAISFLHLFTGNLDHLVRLDMDYGPFPVEFPEESNMGNIMVSLPEEPGAPVSVYSIDNEAYKEVLEPEYSSKLNEFIFNFLQDPDRSEKLSLELVKSIEKATTRGSVFYESKKTRAEKEEMEKGLALFKHDLHDIGIPSLTRGIQEMEERLFSVFQDPRFSLLTENMQRSFPEQAELFADIQSRALTLVDIRKTTLTHV